MATSIVDGLDDILDDGLKLTEVCPGDAPHYKHLQACHSLASAPAKFSGTDLVRDLYERIAKNWSQRNSAGLVTAPSRENWRFERNTEVKEEGHSSQGEG